jgi:class 3 adenylate cyclase
VETLAFLFTDIEGSTALLGRLGDDDYAQVLAGHHALIRSALAAHDGREMDTQGDAFFAVFSSPRACVAAVLQMQQAIQAHAWPGGEWVRVRMGIHCGEAARTATGLVGLEVHRAARMAAVAYGGQVLVSEAAAALVRDWLPPGAALADLGGHRLKDLGRPERRGPGSYRPPTSPDTTGCGPRCRTCARCSPSPLTPSSTGRTSTAAMSRPARHQMRPVRQPSADR